MKKTILITGATKNTGLAIARRFAADGWNVAITSRDAAAAEAAAKGIEGEVLGLGMDPANVADIRGAFAAVKERFGRLDAFVNNAAHLGVGLSVLNSTEADWDVVMNANARAAFFGAQESAKLMKDGGSIVFISSCHAKKSVPGRALYTASKAALVAAYGERMSIGAGTVLTIDEVRAAHEAGASFIVSPDTDPDVIAETKRLGMASIPGAMTPSEIKRAHALGADIVKLFPADDLGYHYIQNLKGPLPHIPIMATGGVNPETIPEFLSRGMVAVGTGITIFRPDLIAAEDYDAIAALAKAHIEAIKNVKM